MYFVLIAEAHYFPLNFIKKKKKDFLFRATAFFSQHGKLASSPVNSCASGEKCKFEFKNSAWNFDSAEHILFKQNSCETIVNYDNMLFSKETIL